TYTVSHAPTHCTTQAVPRDHLHSEPCTNTLHHTSCTYRRPAQCTNTLHHTMSYTLTHCTTQAVPIDHLHNVPCTAPHKLYLGTTYTVSHAPTHCTTQAVPRDHLHSEPCTNTLHHTSCT
ncbi:predicted protein, partial [Nematostella vectensis]